MYNLGQRPITDLKWGQCILMILLPVAVYWNITVCSMYCRSDIFNEVVWLPMFVNFVFEGIEGCCIHDISCHPFLKLSQSSYLMNETILGSPLRCSGEYFCFTHDAQSNSDELCHIKTGLKIQLARPLSFSYKKNAWLSPSTAKPIFGMDPQQCHTQRRLDWAGASQAFFLYDNDKVPKF